MATTTRVSAGRLSRPRLLTTTLLCTALSGIRPAAPAGTTPAPTRTSLQLLLYYRCTGARCNVGKIAAGWNPCKAGTQDQRADRPAGRGGRDEVTMSRQGAHATYCY